MAITQKYVCIHGHFYQPPRENPWLEAIETQESAFPYHDWNERITYECYGANTASRILGHDQDIVDIVNNYARISFNFGPTLLSWMERHDPEIYQAILQADRDSRDLFSGHGSALAQVYNHLIMPLANRRDKHTQVIWGLRDFEHRFGRKPEGMWLAETAVDTETLEALAEHGIRFTILAPRQAQAVRRMGGTDWTDVSGERVNPRVPYHCQLPSGRSIVLFFYDGLVSQDVAFKTGWCRRTWLSRDCSKTGSILPTGSCRRFPATTKPKPGWFTSPRTGIFGKISAEIRGSYLRKQFVELRTRRGAVAQQLRLQLGRQPALAPALAGTAAPCPRLAAR
ncbi:MAG: hypothetical protein MUD08_07210 [Cytophagales bacterium]|nr:hypothetical protein [Cytophagales bacterium]